MSNSPTQKSPRLNTYVVNMPKGLNRALPLVHFLSIENLFFDLREISYPEPRNDIAKA